MSHGGKRPNSGRKAGVPSTKTVVRREIVQKIAAEGLLPLAVMLDNMRFFHEAAAVALRRLLEGTATPIDIVNEHAPQQLDLENPPNTLEAVALILKLRDRAGEAAKDAAPYLHPRLAAIEVRAQRPEEQEIPLLDRLKRYATADAIKASGGKVVELKVSTRPAPTGRKKAKSK